MGTRGSYPSEAPVTIVVTDVVGSTALQAARGDVEGYALIEACDARVRAHVAAHGGRVVKSLGDGVMAAFGSPRGAVACALEIQRELALDAVRSPELAVGVRIGVHTGEVLLDQNGDLYGIAVSGATRVCACGDAGEVLISDVVRQLCHAIPGAELHDHGLHELKGFAEAWRLFRVEPTKRETTTAGESTPFVGRERIRRRLRVMLERAHRGQGGVALITGEPGIGKTRLATEVGAEARQRGFQVLAGHCYDNPGDVPYMPWVEIVESLTRHLGPGKAMELMGANAPALAQMVPELRRMCSDIALPVTLPADQQRRHLLSSVRDFLETAARVRPLALVFEDLQWADESTVTLFEHLAEWIEPIAALVVGTCRDVVAREPTRVETMLARLTRLPTVEFVPLERHTADEVATMVAAMTGRTPPEQVAAALHAESDGNAFFVEQLVRHLDDMGRLFDERGNLRAGLDAGDIDVPHRVRLLTRERLRRLSPKAREVVGVAAVLGRHFRFELLEDLVPTADGDLLDAVEEAERARFLSERRDGNYGFSHELIRHTLLGEISTTRRRRVHARIADVLERNFPEDSAHASDIAEHLLASGLAGPRTARHLVLAGDRAREGAAYEEALRHYARGAKLLDAGAPEQADLLLKRGTALRGLGRWEEATEAWDRALSILEARGDDEAIVGVSYDLCQQLAWAYRFPEMAAVAERARAAIGDRDSPERPRIMGMVGVALALTGQPESADEHAAEARRLADASSDPQVLADVGLSETFHHYFFMRMTRVVDVGRPATEALRAAGSLWNLAETLAFLDVGLVFQGRFVESTELHRELDPLAERLRHSGAASTATRNRFVSAAAERADLAELARLAEHQLRSASLTNNAGWVAFSHTLRGIVDFWSGDWKRARLALNEGAGAAGPFWAPAQRGWLLVLDAWEGHADEVDRGYAELEALLPRLGRPNLIGSWTLAALSAEAIGLVGGRSRADRLHALVCEALATGTLMRQFDGRLLQTVAGMGAAAAGRLDDAREHFEIALRQASELPHRVERPQACHAYARALLEHGDDAERAFRLACDAEREYAAIGMPRHARAAQVLAGVAERRSAQRVSR